MIIPPYTTESFKERQERLAKEQQLNSYKKHKQTCAKNRLKRKKKNKH